MKGALPFLYLSGKQGGGFGPLRMGANTPPPGLHQMRHPVYTTYGGKTPLWLWSRKAEAGFFDRKKQNLKRIGPGQVKTGHSRKCWNSWVTMWKPSCANNLTGKSACLIGGLVLERRAN